MGNVLHDVRDEGLRILTCGTRDKASRQTVSRDSRGRKKSTVPQVSQVGSSHYIGNRISVSSSLELK